MHQQQQKPIEILPEYQSSLKSSAFPTDLKVAQQSIFHPIISRSQQVSSSFTMRPFHDTDLYQLRNLQLQWFPLRYGDYFYHRLLNHHYECILAECLVSIKGKTLANILMQQKQKYEKNASDPKKINNFWEYRMQYFQAQEFFNGEWQQSQNILEVKIIVGAVVFQFSDSRGYLGSSWWSQYVFGVRNTMYISTLGVIQEFRKRKVAHKLLEIVQKTAQTNQNIKLVLLHVIQYNQAAIKLYKKFSFEIFQEILNFYNIEKKTFTGIVMGKFFNSGTRKKNWGQWLRSFW